MPAPTTPQPAPSHSAVRPAATTPQCPCNTAGMASGCSNSYGNGAQDVQVDESECSASNQPCRSNSYNCGGTWQAIYQINNMQQLSCCSKPAFYGNDRHSAAGAPDGASAIQFINSGSGPWIGTGTLDAIMQDCPRQPGRLQIPTASSLNRRFLSSQPMPSRFPLR